MSNKTELLQKIKALADRGIGGEQETAQALLARLMQEYGISETELEGERRETAFFSYSQDTERRLLNQIIYMVTGSSGCGAVGAWSGRKRKKLGADVTAAERLEIEMNYSFFKEAMKKELEIFFSAFANKNGLFPSPDKVAERGDEDPTEEDLVRAAKAKRTEIYYSHPYASSERGSNEKQNQMIRRRFPKGTDFQEISGKEVDKAMHWLNHYPREIFDFASSEELFQQEILSLAQSI